MQKWVPCQLVYSYTFNDNSFATQKHCHSMQKQMCTVLNNLIDIILNVLALFLRVLFTMLIINREIHMPLWFVWYTENYKAITKCVHFVWTFFIFGVSWIRSPSRPSFILKIAAGSAALKSFHSGPASLLWLPDFDVLYLNTAQAKKPRQTLDSSPEESGWMQPNSDTCHFVSYISTPSNINVMNEEIQLHALLSAWWDGWSHSLTAWIWEPGRGFGARWVIVSILNSQSEI